VAAADRIAEEPGSIVGDFVVDDAAVAQVVLSSDGQGFVIPTNDLPALEQTRTYQLWVVNDTEDVISAGVLGNSPVPATFTWTGEVTGFALTREVAGGVVSSAGDVVSVISDV
jgi:anti-sigma-K factor RskA